MSDLPRTAKSECLTTVFLSVTSLLEGVLFWFLVPRLIERMFNLAVPINILIFILAVFIFFSFVNLLRYSLGKRVRRWQLDIVFTVLLLVTQFALGEFYMLVLPQLDPDPFFDVFWKSLLFPFATWVIILNLMYHKMPRFKEKVDRYNHYDSLDP